MVENKLTFEHLSNAPIIQSILDIQFVSESPTSNNSIQTLHSLIKDKYPSKEPSPKVLLDESNQAKGIIHDGFIFISAEKHRLLGATSSYFNLTQNYPYNNWEEFAGEFIELWKHYAKIVNPSQIKRISTRFINKFEAEAPLAKMDTYFTSYLNIPDAFPQTIKNFMLAYTLPFEEDDCIVNVIETIGEPINNENVSFILDIDVLMSKEFEYSLNTVESVLAKLHYLKNDIFRKCLTDEIYNKLK